MWLFSCYPTLGLIIITFCLNIYAIFEFRKEIKEFFVKLFQ